MRRRTAISSKILATGMSMGATFGGVAIIAHADATPDASAPSTTPPAGAAPSTTGVFFFFRFFFLGGRTFHLPACR